MNDSNYMFEQLHVLKVSLFEDEKINPALDSCFHGKNEVLNQEIRGYLTFRPTHIVYR